MAKNTETFKKAKWQGFYIIRLKHTITVIAGSVEEPR